MQFRDILKNLREERNLTQKRVADACGLSSTCVCQLETGIRNPTGTTLVALADFFEVSTDYLLGRSDDFGNISIRTPSFSLNSNEKELLFDFRALPRPEQAQALEYIHFLASKRGNKNKHA